MRRTTNGHGNCAGGDARRRLAPRRRPRTPRRRSRRSQAAALAKQLAQAKLQYIATKDPTDPGRFVAAMHVPGTQLMIVSARYGAPALLNEKVLLGKFQDAYIDLNSASEAATRVIVEDLRADGFALTKGKDMLRDSFESNGKRVDLRLRLAQAEADRRPSTSAPSRPPTRSTRGCWSCCIAEAPKPR